MQKRSRTDTDTDLNRVADYVLIDGTLCPILVVTGAQSSADGLSQELHQNMGER